MVHLKHIAASSRGALLGALLGPLLALGLAACTTPQIPLPPPNPGDLALEVRVTEQEIRITGQLDLAGGQVSLIDANGDGVIRHIGAGGTFDTGFFPAADGAQLTLTYTDGQRSSDPLCLRVTYSPPGLLLCP